MTTFEPKVPTLAGTRWAINSGPHYTGIDRSSRIGVYCEGRIDAAVEPHALWLCGSFLLEGEHWSWQDVFTTADRVQFNLKPQALDAGHSSTQTLVDDAPFDREQAMRSIAPASSAQDVARYTAELGDAMDRADRARSKPVLSCPECVPKRRHSMRLERIRGVLERLRLEGVQEVSLPLLSKMY